MRQPCGEQGAVGAKPGRPWTLGRARGVLRFRWESPCAFAKPASCFLFYRLYFIISFGYTGHRLDIYIVCETIPLIALSLCLAITLTTDCVLCAAFCFLEHFLLERYLSGGKKKKKQEEEIHTCLTALVNISASET